MIDLYGDHVLTCKKNTSDTNRIMEVVAHLMRNAGNSARVNNRLTTQIPRQMHVTASPRRF